MGEMREMTNSGFLPPEQAHNGTLHMAKKNLVKLD